MQIVMTRLFLFLYFNILILNQLVKSEDSCYTPNGLPKRCSPPFINAAFKRTITATNTCGVNRRSDYCVQTQFQYEYGETRPEKCDICDDNMNGKSHRPELMTDAHVQESPTWWQSDSMEYPDIQYPNSINITLNLGKSFDITYVQLRFHSSRPDSFVIYKRTNETSAWIPYQYYSSNCEEIYNVSRSTIITKENEDVALCIDEYSDIAPLSGGSIVFSTLEARPSAFTFTESDLLKEWVTATDIRITLNRLNTFGDEVFGDPKVLRSYYYAISDIAVGGSCKCNGHASRCSTFQDSDLEEKYRCECEHNTAGNDCEKCAQFFNDRPWAPATYLDANECRACECNGLSDKCVFNQTLYDATGHGGHCIECRFNTEGPHCESCKFSFYRNEYDQCISCDCNEEGSLSLQCDPTGRCKCKPGVSGEKCDKCAANYYDLTNAGCKECSCSLNGSLDSPPICSQKDGKCRCKQNVEGKDCDRCKPGFFNLDSNNDMGCLDCFCYTHTSDCKNSTNYEAHFIESNLQQNELEDWTAVDTFGKKVFTGTNNSTGIYVFASDKDAWFTAPAKYLGNQLASYNQDLSFTLKFLYRQSSLYRKDIIIENAQKRIQVHQTFYDKLDLEEIASPEPITKEFKFRLKEKNGWVPYLRARDFQVLLSNITSIKIKASLGDYTFLHNFRLKSAIKKSGKNISENVATWIEECKCPEGHTGQFCERCQVGYKRAKINGDVFTKCIPCSCNNHSTTCDPDTGKCNCMHQTTGDFCEVCKEGYYGDALIGTPNDCKKCICPNDGPCTEIFNYQSNVTEVVCLNCPTGTRGNICEICDDGYYEADVLDNNEIVCKKCVCNSNIDENAVANCDTKTGKCLRCLFNTTGDSCEKCLNSYWGDALTNLKCHACECNKLGSIGTECDLDNGQCTCKNNVIGRQCNECKESYWNIKSGEGCSECKCNPLGSISLSCDQNNGTCSCRPGVTGVKCDECLPNHYGFSGDGCKPCDCDPFGSLSRQCDIFGRCKCRENIGGYKCDKCAENFHNFTIGCTKCPDCYNLVQKGVEYVRGNLTELNQSLQKIITETKSNVNDEKNKELENQLNLLKVDINRVHKDIFENEEFDLFKPSYDKTVKNLNDTIENINLEYRKIQKPIDALKLKINQLADINNKFNKTLQELISVAPRINELEKDLNASKIVIEEELSNSIHHNSELQIKFKNFAKTARKSANDQISIAKEFSNNVADNIRFAKNSLDQLKSLITLTNNLNEVTFDIKYDLLVKTASKLNEEAQTVKSKLNADYLDLSKSINELTVLNIVESDYDPAMNKSAENIKDFHLRIKNTKENIDKLNVKFNNFLKENETNIDKAAQEIKRVEVKHEDLFHLLEKSEMIKNETDKAFTMLLDIHGNASNILETLKNFNDVYEANKLKASIAQRLIPEINANMDDTQKEFKKIKEGFKKVKHNILNTTNLIESNNANISKNNKNFDELISIFSNLNNKTSSLNEKVKLTNTNYIQNRDNIQSSLKIYNELPETIAGLNKNASIINTDAKILLTKVEVAQEDLDDLANSNTTFEGVTKEQVDRLAKRFQEALAELELFDSLENVIADLNERQERNQEKIKLYEREIPELKKNIADLTHIRDNINRVKCINNVNPLPPAF